jgi:hypothetical protein
VMAGDVTDSIPGAQAEGDTSMQVETRQKNPQSGSGSV